MWNRSKLTDFKRKPLSDHLQKPSNQFRIEKFFENIFNIKTCFINKFITRGQQIIRFPIFV